MRFQGARARQTFPRGNAFRHTGDFAGHAARFVGGLDCCVTASCAGGFRCCSTVPATSATGDGCGGNQSELAGYRDRELRPRTESRSAIAPSSTGEATVTVISFRQIELIIHQLI